jgi:hypothetical protein
MSGINMKLIDLMIEWSIGVPIDCYETGYMSCKTCRVNIGVVHDTYIYVYGINNGKIMSYEPNFFEQIMKRSEHPCAEFKAMTAGPTFTIAG